ncbi:hypothetical protein [Kutzneria sp. NPDC052558]|jgi:hypothetical protein|uniref:hypothetical protein n=1 Tax=Kutzneria sp. NPDC052558 TaxID=3364121 RepID=UPI0037CA96C1
MTASQQPTQQQERAARALTHFHFCLGFLTVGDVSGANDYLKDVQARDGQLMYQTVCDMIAVHTRIPRLEP